MLRLYVMGAVSLRADDGTEIASVLAQPKRFALLAYLAIASHGGYHRRDTLLALFWPELDQPRARRALRQAVHFLRRELGAHLVTGRGDEDLTVAPETLWCDARALAAAVAEERAADAMALYRGDLLDGFHVSDASGDLDDWLERERTALRDGVARAAWALSARSERAGDMAEAVRCARWAVARTPHDERALRRLLSLLDASGDRAGAIQAYDAFAARLSTDLEVEPSSETRALVDTIRARARCHDGWSVDDALPAGRATPADPIELHETVVVPEDVPAPVGIGLPETAPPPARHRAARVMAGVAAGLVVTAALSPWALARARGAHASDVSGIAPAAVTTTSPVARSFYEEGLRALFLRGRNDEAHGLFTAALRADSSFAMAAYYVAETDSNGATSLPELAHAVRLADHATERERLIIRMGWAGAIESPTRIDIAESLAARYPDAPEGHLALASAVLGTGEFLGAAAHYQRVIAIDSSGRAPLCEACAGYDGLTTAYLLADSLAAAERTARAWIVRQPRSQGPWTALWNVLIREGRQDDAMVALRHMNELGSSMSVSLPAAIAAVHADQLGQAAHVLSAEVPYEGTPAQREALWWLIIVRRNQGRLADALSLAHELLPLPAPEYEGPAQTAVIAEAQVLFEMGRYRDAAVLFDSLAAVVPGSTRPYASAAARHRSWLLTLAGTAWAASGDTVRLASITDSVEAIAHLSAYGRDWRLPHYLRALLWRARGDTLQAVDEFRRAIWSPSDGYTRVNLELARTLLALRRPQDAIDVLRPALDGPVDASNYYVTRTDLHRALADAYRAAGEPDSAAVQRALVSRAVDRTDASGGG